MTSKLTLRTCTLENILELQDISVKTMVDTFGKDNTEEDMKEYVDSALNLTQLEKELKNPDSEFYFADFEGKLAGYLKVNKKEAQTETHDPNGLEIHRIYILPEFKRRGIGKFLINHAEKIAREAGCGSMWLGVWERNFGALEFYKNMGFVQTGSHEFLLGTDRQTDLIMTKALQ
ncbi:putative polyamine N-acetyltransferase [Blattamonas nauphoetae]|uniref:Polyamine N-acetyltransferase n=1 Tax=Blattamonas nauphoetae TaxID=2049346 RepID=A0ABQ9YAR7_9EUKA|nr:putative polyamine N-acetyltransferase [Blattamonas nauphoetae]